MKKVAEIDTQSFYDKYYDLFLYRGFLGKIFTISHKMIEKRFNKFEGGQILELAATHLYHLKFVKQKFDLYTVSDININAFPKNLPEKVQVQQLNALNLNLVSDNTFDRVIVTCLIIHLSDMNSALLEWRRVLKPGGYISIYIHCEPGLLLRISRYFGSNIKAKMLGYEHLKIVYTNHVSHYLSAKYSIQKVFVSDEISISSFPFPKFSWNFNLWKIYTIQKSTK